MMAYVDYDRWVKLINDRIGNAINDKKIMEIGCGTGEISKRLADCGYEVCGIDISEEMLKIAGTKYPNLNIKKDIIY